MRVVDSLGRIALILAVGFWAWIIYGWLSAHDAPLILVIAGGIVLGAVMLAIGVFGILLFFEGKQSFNEGMSAFGAILAIAVLGVSIYWFL